MIYQALYELAQREELLADTAYEPQPVHFILEIDADGQLLEILEPRVPAPVDAKGKPRGKAAPLRRPIPRRSDRTVNVQAEFLVDKAEYVFGIDPTGERKPEKLTARRDSFRSGVDDALRELPESAGLRAVNRFLSTNPPEKILGLLRAEKAPEQKALAAALFAFRLHPGDGVSCVHDEPAVKEYFRRKLQSTEGAVTGQCLVTGERHVPLTELHAKPKGIPPVSKTKGGVPLTAVNQDAFKSYGLDIIGGAPVSRHANVAVELALNRLLDPAYPRQRGGEAFPRRSIQVSPDTVLVYWSRQDAALDFVLGIEGRDPEEVAELLRSPFKTYAAPLQDPTDFYALILSGSTGRAIVRSFLHSTVREVAGAVERYRQEARIVRPFEGMPGGYPLLEIRRALVPRADLELLSPALGARVYLDILRGTEFPHVVLEASIRRNRVGDLDARRLGARCSLLKAYFIRNQKEEITVSLDASRIDPAYRLGRLLAAVDKAQQEALGSLNATLVDRYYGAASSTPAVVFPSLLRRFQNHLSKLRREKPGLAIVRERLVQEIVGDLLKFPPFLKIEEQGLFALGFYQQRQDLFTKKEEESNEPAN